MGASHAVIADPAVHSLREPTEPPAGEPHVPSVRAAEGVAGAAVPLAPRVRRGAIEALCQTFGVHRLAFFGSELRADFDPAAGSDVDATVEFRDVTGLPTARQFFDFKAALEQHLQCEVDLVELDAMPETRLKRIIARTQRPFYVEAA